MDIDYSLIYDLFAAVLLIGTLFAGLKKGFAGAVVSAAAVIAGFLCASLISKPVTDYLYTIAVEQPLENAVDTALDEAMDSVVLHGIEKLNYDKVIISGVPANEITPSYGGTGKALIELGDLDLSATGIEAVDLTPFGIAADTDFSSVSAKTADFTMVEIEKYGLGKLAVAQYIAVNAAQSDFFGKFNEYISSVTDALPLFFGSAASEVKSGTLSAVRFVVLLMSDGVASVKGAIIDKVVAPAFRMFTNTIVFILVFSLVTIVLSLVANALQIINKIPLLGKANAFLGAVFGIAEGVLSLMVICVALRMIISLSGGNIVFINEMTINSTHLFKLFYNYQILDFLT